MLKHLLIVIMSVSGWLTASAANGTIPITATSPEAIALYQQATVLEGQLQIDAADTAYRAALALDSTFALAHLRLAMLRDDYAIRRTHVLKAVEYMDRVSPGEQLWIQGRNHFYGTQDGKEEYTCFKELQALHPDDENANYLFGYVHIYHGKHEPERAIPYLEKALQLNPQVYRHYDALINAHLENRDFLQAEKVIKSYIDFLPQHERPRDTYADMLMRDHRYAASIEAYRDVLKINPAAPWAFMGRAANLSFLGKYTAARRILDSLDQIPLSYYEYRHKWRGRVCSYLVEGKLDSAIVVLQQQQAESTSGENDKEPLFHEFITWSRITRLYFENNQPAAGLRSYQSWKRMVQEKLTRASTIDRILALENYFNAYAHFLNGDHTAAQALLDQEADPSEDWQLLQARLHLQQDKPKAAIAMLEQLDEHNPYYLYWLAQAYRAAEQEEHAAMTIEKIKALIELHSVDYALVANKI